MRETSFIRQNKDKWEDFEETYKKDDDPEKLSNLFIQITDDLSYARTYYPNRSVRIYLNNLAQRVFHGIYKNKVRRRHKFSHFWREELPLRLYDARKNLLFGLILFVVSFAIGVFSSMHDPDFARHILGDEYVSMTEQNIASGDPMKVYKEMNEYDMFFAITFNNLLVAFITMALGLLFGLGTAYYIIFNGIMIGTFQYFFIERDLFWESFLAIWVHGALEVSAIVIAGGAGFTLGSGFLFPGTLTRLQAFRINALRAVQIFIGIAPVIILAAINESFLTRYTETPDIVRGGLILVEFAFMYFYYVYYPKIVAQRAPAGKKRHDEIPANKPIEFQLNTIKNSGQIFGDGFQLFRKYGGSILAIVATTGIIYIALLFSFIVDIDSIYHATTIVRFQAIVEAVRDFKSLTNYHHTFELKDVDNGQVMSTQIKLFLLNTTAMAMACLAALYPLVIISQKKETYSIKAFLRFAARKGWMILLIMIALHSILLLQIKIERLLFYGMFPVACLFMAAWMLKKENSNWLREAWTLTAKYILQIELLYFPLLLLTIMIACLSHSVITAIHIQLVTWNIPFEAKLYEAIQDITITGTLMITIFAFVAMIASNMGLMLFSLRETESGNELRSRIQTQLFPKNSVK